MCTRFHVHSLYVHSFVHMHSCMFMHQLSKVQIAKNSAHVFRTFICFQVYESYVDIICHMFDRGILHTRTKKKEFFANFWFETSLRKLFSKIPLTWLRETKKENNLLVCRHPPKPSDLDNWKYGRFGFSFKEDRSSLNMIVHRWIRLFKHWTRLFKNEDDRSWMNRSP